VCDWSLRFTYMSRLFLSSRIEDGNGWTGGSARSAALPPPSSPSSSPRGVYSPGCDAPECNNTVHFGEAVAAAKTADAIVVVLGLHYSAAGNATQCDHDQPYHRRSYPSITWLVLTEIFLCHACSC
jgi:hypothetical protein